MPLASAPPRPVTPIRAFGRFLLAAIYFLIVRLIAQHSARGLTPEDWTPLVDQLMQAFLLMLGFIGFGFVLDGQLEPLRAQGLKMRPGWLGEVGLGLAFGWAIAVICVLPMVIFGGIAMRFIFTASAFRWLAADTAFFLVATFVVQLAFRGYPFQVAIKAIGELPAALMLAVLYGIMQAFLPGATYTSMAVNIALGLLLATAYLRTRALWLPWGLHFAWIASRALLFGLTVNGVSSHSPVAQGDPLSPLWLTGGEFGLDGSWVAFIVILVAMPFLYRATRDLSFEYNAPIIIPGGIEVDLDAAQQRQHESATREAAPEVKPLVQILPAAPAAPLPWARDIEIRPASPEPPPLPPPISETSAKIDSSFHQNVIPLCGLAFFLGTGLSFGARLSGADCVSSASPQAEVSYGATSIGVDSATRGAATASASHNHSNCRGIYWPGRDNRQRAGHHDLQQARPEH
jgi:membrane protease YdiL (CAAX protease family)